MIIYLAGGFTPLNDIRKELALAQSMSRAHSIYPRLVSFYPYSEKMIETVLSLKNHPDITGKIEIKIVLDSGAFSARKAGITLNVEDYAHFVKKYEDKLDHYFNLDVIGDGEISYQNYMYMLSEGLSPIPVYHLNTPIRYLDFYLKKSDYIGIGADGKWTTPATGHTLNFLFRKYFTDSAGLLIIKVHALGLCSVQILHRYPWHSADTTAPFQNSVRRSGLVPRKENEICRYDLPPKVISLSQKRSHASNHISNLSPDDCRAALDYIAEKADQLEGK